MHVAHSTRTWNPSETGMYSLHVIPTYRAARAWAITLSHPRSFADRALTTDRGTRNMGRPHASLSSASMALFLVASSTLLAWPTVVTAQTPLPEDSVQTFTDAVGDYSIGVSTNHYAVVGAKWLGGPGTCIYLRTWDNPTQTGSPLAVSGCFTTLLFHVFDGHSLGGPSTYFPQTDAGSTATYAIEYEDGTAVDTLAVDTPLTSSFTSGELFDAYDVQLTAGVTYNVTLSISAGAVWWLYLFQGMSLDDLSYLALSASTTAAATQRVVVTPPTTGWYAIVVTNENGASGSYTLTAKSDFVAEDVARAVHLREVTGSAGSSVYAVTG